MRAATIILAIAVLTACAAPTHIEGHKIRATADSTVETVTVSDGLHDRAPAWFKEYWRGYLRQAEGGYAVLALDRNGRGAFYVYCGAGPACQTLNLGGAKTFSDVHYKHEALKRCHGQVRKQYPAVKPDCAIYAIKNKIVWQGKLPWERWARDLGESSAPRAGQRHTRAAGQALGALRRNDLGGISGGPHRHRHCPPRRAFRPNECQAGREQGGM